MATVVSGSALRPNVEWMRRDCGEDAWQRVLSRLDDEERRSIELLNDGVKYPASLFDHLNRAYADVRFQGDAAQAGQAFRDMGHHAAVQHLSGIYSIFLKVASPQATMSRIPALLGRLYEGVEGTAEFPSEPGGPRGIMRVSGLGNVAYSAPRLVGWAEGALEKVGAANPRVVERAWEARQIAGDPLVFELYWK